MVSLKLKPPLNRLPSPPAVHRWNLRCSSFILPSATKSTLLCPTKPREDSCNTFPPRQSPFASHQAIVASRRLHLAASPPSVGIPSFLFRLKSTFQSEPSSQFVSRADSSLPSRARVFLLLFFV
uniref:Uncharacterized protein n=1 Tax=Cucumis sativus TaxID=3659 RepID=A0A0A0K259_CUCSA